MLSYRETEHFVTLFDNSFLPIGMALHKSLMQFAQPFSLWIICIDDELEKNLHAINLPFVNIISLSSIENPQLLSVKEHRTKGEYCWTLSPFTYEAVFDRDPAVSRVTYIDSDLFFFNDPRILIEELINSGKQVLITDHAYDPKYDQSKQYGKFCVQFLTVFKSPGALKVIHWWKERCLEWCYGREENGKFGDQKYLDYWPQLFNEEVHILKNITNTLAPWNIDFQTMKLPKDKCNPVFYHFHSLRLISAKKVKLYSTYKIGKKGRMLYKQYLIVLSEIVKNLLSQNIRIFPTAGAKQTRNWFSYIKDVVILKRESYARLSSK